VGQAIQPTRYFERTCRRASAEILLRKSGGVKAANPAIYASLRYRLPMTLEAFRRLALALPESVEREHMNHPDFRVGGRIFATLSYPDKTRGMVKLNPAQQEEFVGSHPRKFAPVNGVWGGGVAPRCT